MNSPAIGLQSPSGDGRHRPVGFASRRHIQRPGAAGAVLGAIVLLLAIGSATAGVVRDDPKPFRFVEAPRPAGGWLLWSQCFAKPNGEVERCLWALDREEASEPVPVLPGQGQLFDLEENAR